MSMGYELPTTLTVGGVAYPIRSDYRAVLDVLRAMSDAELDGYARAYVVLCVMYPEHDKIPPEHVNEAVERACEFISCGGQEDDGRPHPRLIDWDKDAEIIMPAVNSVAHTELRALPYLHWWTFWGYFMSVGESVLGTVLAIRQKQAMRKPLTDGEKEYYRANKKLIDLDKRETAEERKMREEAEAMLENWLDGR